MRLPILTWTTTTKLAAGAVGALAVAGGASGLTAAIIHVTTPPPAASAPAATPAPASGAKRANPAARAIRLAMLQSEAQALGLDPQQLSAQLRQGSTIQQLATAKGLDEAGFATQVTTDLKPLLDQDVQNGTLTGKQEQNALKRFAQTVPNWDQVARPPAVPPAPAQTGQPPAPAQ